jgi:hypothetical protein
VGHRPLAAQRENLSANAAGDARKLLTATKLGVLVGPAVTAVTIARFDLHLVCDRRMNMVASLRVAS